MGEVDRPHAAVYWTYPVPWAGFNDLPRDVDEAAGRSRSIRYQRDLVRTHVAAERGTLVREFVFLETSPDHATDVGYRDVMGEIVSLCGKGRITLCYVAFGEAMGWRKHELLRIALEREGIRTDPVSPRPIPVDGRTFDPVAHFREWRRVNSAFRQRRKLTAAEALAMAQDSEPAGYGRNVRIAERLNAGGVTTSNGMAWTADNVRMALKVIARPAEGPSR